MLINELTIYCDKNYMSSCAGSCMRYNQCNHAIMCPGGCSNCLHEIHFPEKDSDRCDYDCVKLIDFYVCRYTHKYASEILYLIERSRILNDMRTYKILSLGCGGCSDLIAFDTFAADKNIAYIGIVINKLWEHVHNFIHKYRDNSNGRKKFIKNFGYFDAIKTMQTKPQCNVLVLNYVLSSIHRSTPGKTMNFLRALYAFMTNQKLNRPFVFLFNDINHVFYGRNDLDRMIYALQNFYGERISIQSFYFDYKNDDNGKVYCYGTKHDTSVLRYSLPYKLRISQYGIREFCTSAQVLIEIF